MIIRDEGAESSQEIKLTTLDKYCDINDVNHIDVLKIDVEGHEPEVIKGAKNILADKKVDMIFLEVHPSLGEFYDSLVLLGYEYFYYDYASSSLLPVLNVSGDNVANSKPTEFHSNIILIQKNKVDIIKSFIETVN